MFNLGIRNVQLISHVKIRFIDHHNAREYKKSEIENMVLQNSYIAVYKKSLKAIILFYAYLLPPEEEGKHFMQYLK